MAACDTAAFRQGEEPSESAAYSHCPLLRSRLGCTASAVDCPDCGPLADHIVADQTADPTIMVGKGCRRCFSTE